MSLKWKLTKLFAALEDTFGTDPDADGSDYKFLPTLGDIVFQPQMEVIQREGQVNKFTRQSHVMGAKKGTLTFKLYLKASGLAAAVTAAAAAECDGILQSLFGNVTRGTSTAVTGAGSTTSVIDVTDASTLAVGMAVNIGGETRIITAVNTAAAPDNITLDRALASIPAAAVVVYASSMYRPYDNGHQSLAFCANRDGIEYTFLGCTVSCKLTSVNALGLATLEVTAAVADWSTSTKASLPSTVPTGITAIKPPSVKGAPLAIGGTEEPCYGFEFDPGIKFEYQESTKGAGFAGGDGNVFGFEKTAGEAQGVVKAYYAAAHMTDFVAGTERSIVVSAGTYANGWALYINKAQHTAPAFEEHKGTAGESLPFAVNDAGSANGGYDFTLCLF